MVHSLNVKDDTLNNYRTKVNGMQRTQKAEQANVTFRCFVFCNSLHYVMWMGMWIQCYTQRSVAFSAINNWQFLDHWCTCLFTFCNPYRIKKCTRKLRLSSVNSKATTCGSATKSSKSIFGRERTNYAKWGRQKEVRYWEWRRLNGHIPYVQHYSTSVHISSCGGESFQPFGINSLSDFRAPPLYRLCMVRNKTLVGVPEKERHGKGLEAEGLCCLRWKAAKSTQMDKRDLCSFVLTLVPDVQLQNVRHDITAALPEILHLNICSSKGEGETLLCQLASGHFL